MRATIYSDGAKLIYLKRDELLRNLESLAQELAREIPEVDALYLFGSLARGEQRGLSDVDLLAVVSVPLNRSNFWKVYERVFNFMADRLQLEFDLIVVEKNKAEETLRRLGTYLLISKT
ncbi:MAG: nucleotidyltransferase family protein, partial [Aquificaceae bacterium]|uniref:nucleotidyltransferase family protein n=1 Tax=Hydrogenobacter sp. Uz 6-8 TaxID=3384828 RepID=UPI0030B0C17D